MTMTVATVDRTALETKVKSMYSDVAANPHGEFHFEMGRFGGAAQREDYRTAIETAGLQIERVEENAEYRFISERAQKATAKWGVKSVSILARKP
jgi:hypothetical protein